MKEMFHPIKKSIKTSNLEIQNVFYSADHLLLKNSQKFELC